MCITRFGRLRQTVGNTSSFDKILLQQNTIVKRRVIMNTKSLLATFESELTYLQQKEIEEGKKKGLSDKQISLYSGREYNFLQMKEIRLALEHGIEMRDVRKMLDSSLSFEKMREIRLQLENKEKVIVHRNVMPVFIVVIVLLFVTLFVPVYSKPYLSLKKDCIELKQGDTFEAMAYIDKFRGKGKLIVPSNVDTNKKGNQIVVYKLITDEKEIEKTLLIKII